jgi:phosphotriesterase-related protein
MHIVAATGLHLRLYYPADHWYDTIGEEELTELFIDETENGVTDFGTSLDAKAGVIKVAGSLDRLTDLERRNFRAAGLAQRATGCPILTHTEQGTAALEQVAILLECGAEPKHIVLSHLDRSFDLGYLREVLSTGVKLEFDSAFRWKEDPNHTLDLLVELSPEFPTSFVLGMDAARQSYWSSFGGKPGLGFLITMFRPMLLEAGLCPALVDKLLVDNPREAYEFAIPKETQTG